MNGQYALVEDGAIVRLGARPNWWYDDGRPVTDQRLAEDGWLPLVEADTPFDPTAQFLTPRQQAEWIIEGDRVVVPHDVEPLPPPTADDVIAERARRLAMGFDYDFGNERGVHRIGTTEADMRGWDEVSKGASAAIALGQPGAAIQIVTDTGPVVITALEWQQILLGAAAFRQPVWQASFVLQALNPIPSIIATTRGGHEELSMIKLDSLREALTSALPDEYLGKNPDLLKIFVEDGNVAARMAAPPNFPNGTFEYGYRLTAFLMNLPADKPDVVMAAIVLWLHEHQPALLQGRESAIGFEAEVIDDKTIDLLVRLDLTESVRWVPREGGGHDLVHMPEPPAVDEIAGVPRWTPLVKLYLNDQLVLDAGAD